MTKILRLGSIAPNFTAQTTQGSIDFHHFIESKWTILFSHPSDFTPVCTTELGEVAKLTHQFDLLNTKVIGLSCNSLIDHHSWIQDINRVNSCEVNFPIIADPSREIATLYQMLDEQDLTNQDQNQIPFTVRSVFIIDPKKKIRLILQYPASTGRQFNEILRSLKSLQLSDQFQITTPANWNPGERVIIHPSVSDQDAQKIFTNGIEFKTPYLRLTEL
ncbi:thioredoxin-like protein [Melampsora americana]|nr:thioredoxin-like protein [Melampsora americana]